MNKFFTKVAAFSACLAMAIGVGVAVASNSKEATPVQAAGSSDWVQVTALSGLNTSDTYVITNDADKGYYMNGTVSSGHFQSTAFSASAPASATAAGAFKLEAIDASNNIYKIKLVSTSKYVYATKAGSGGGSVTGSSDSSGWKFLLSGTSFNAIYQTAYSSKYAAMRCYSNTSWRTYSNNSATSISTTSGTVFRLYKYQSKTLSSITLGGTYDTEFTVGDTFNHTGMTVTANYSDSTTATVTSSATWSSPDMSTSGTKQVTVSYTEGGTTKTASYNITVNPAGITYTVTNSVSNATLSSSASVAENDPLNVTITPDSHYSLPTSLTSVTMGGNTLTAGSGYTYNSSTGAFSIASVTGNVVITGACVEDAKYTVTYVAGDHGSGSNYVVNNQYAGSYTLATFATAGFSADSGYSFKKWSVGGVEYAEGASITLSANTTVTAVYDEVTTYTIVTDASTLKDGTTFVLVGYISSTYYVTNGLNSGHVLLTSKTAATTISNGVESGSTLVSTEAQVLTLEGSTGAFKIKYGDSYLKFTGTSNGNDSFDTEANASTFSASMSGSYILFTCTSSTGNGRVWRMNTGSKDMRNYATSSGVGDVYMFANIPASNELDSVTTSGQNTSFTAGNKWSYGGTLTAHYTLEADATVTPTSFKFGDSGINPTTAGTAITTDTTLNHDTHNGKYIYVIYTEDDITKYCSYQITVNYAAVTSVVIDTHSAEIGLNETYDYTLVGVTVNTSYADQGYEWIVHANTVGDDYTFDGSGLKSKDTEGTITLWCRSTADNSKYDELVVTVTGDPTAEFTPASVSGYVGKGTSVAFTYGNMDDTSKISVSSNNASVTVGAITASAGEGSVAITFVSVGSATLSISYDGGSALDTVGVTVSADSVTALTWSAPTIKVYSGAATTVSDASSWNVHYTMASGDEGDLSYGEYTLKLGGSSITLPHTWDASEDGKVLSIEYGGFSSPTTSTVNVTQTLQAVMAPVEGEPTTSTLTFTKKYSEGGATSDGGEEWTVASDAASGESNFDSIKGIHYGTGTSGTGNVTYITLTTSDFGSGNISQIVVNASTASGVTATVGVTVGGVQFGGDPQSLSSSATDYTFTGSAAADEIIVTITKPSNAAKALYCKSIAVTYTESSGEETNIANVAGHEAAQKAVVAFAKAMNAAFDDTANCTDDVAVADAWDTASSAYSSNIANNASLSADEKAYAKNLIKYASAQYTDDTDNDYSYCLERAMKTYEVCIQKHGQTAFMSDVRPVVANVHVSPLGDLSKNSGTMIIVAVTSLVAVAAIGGYFLLGKRKED